MEDSGRDSRADLVDTCLPNKHNLTDDMGLCDGNNEDSALKEIKPLSDAIPEEGHSNGFKRDRLNPSAKKCSKRDNIPGEASIH